MKWDHPSSGEPYLASPPLLRPPGRTWPRVDVPGEWMPDVTVERRNAPRYPMVLEAEVVELPSGAKLRARTSDLSRTGCYIDTINPLPQGSKVRVRLTHRDQVLQALGEVVYTSYGLGMGICFTEASEPEQAKLDGWLAQTNDEF